MLVESREAIKPRPSLLDLDVPLSVHPAPDILGLRFCLCEVQISRVHVFQRFSHCYSYARSRDKIRVLRQYSDHTDFFLRVNFIDEDGAFELSRW